MHVRVHLIHQYMELLITCLGMLHSTITFFSKCASVPVNMFAGMLIGSTCVCVGREAVINHLVELCPLASV